MEQFLIDIVKLFGQEEFRHWFFWTALLLGIFAGWSPFGFWNGIYKIVKSRKKTTTRQRRGDPDVTNTYNNSTGEGT